jgi:molecular chaperone GrpE
VTKPSDADGPDADAMENQTGGEAPPTETVDEGAAEVEAAAEAGLESLQKELEEARAQAAEYLDGWQRVQAEFSNFRKRQEAERQQLAQMSNATLIARILPVLDDLARAVQTVPPNLQTLTWVEGVFLIRRKMEMVLESEGVKPIETAGRTFDPRYHEAVTYEEAEGFEEGQIVGEIQRGYTLDERVIRPALVRVARAAEVPAAAGEENQAERSAPADAND